MSMLSLLIQFRCKDHQ